ncbi:hypothetical protein BDV18DRAFT_135906 [Aspergillus unguis]
MQRAATMERAWSFLWGSAMVLRPYLYIFLQLAIPSTEDHHLTDRLAIALSKKVLVMRLLLSLAWLLRTVAIAGAQKEYFTSVSV